MPEGPAKRFRRCSLLRIRLLTVLFSAFISFGVLSAGNCGQASAQETLHIDIPTKLDKANVVIDFGHAVFNGDTPFGLGEINLLATDFRDWNTKGQIVVIFHGDAAYLILNDETYYSNRHVAKRTSERTDGERGAT